MTAAARASRSPGRRWLALIACAAVAVGVLPAGAPSATAADVDYASLVNPFVGTESEGNAYPGATVPFGMVQPSPDNSNSYGSTSYSFNAHRVWGFSQRHINSAGCPAAGELLVTPTTTATPQTTRQSIAIASGETAQAGYYGVTLANQVTAELTATTRTAVHRYTFPSTTTANLSFNLGQTLRDARGSSLTWVDDRTLEGWIDNGGFCGGTDVQRYFFSVEFDRAPASHGAWGGDAVYLPGIEASESEDGANGAVAVFDTTEDQTVEVSIGVSFVSVEGAAANRVAELAGGATFDDVHAAASERWNAILGRIDVTASDDLRRIFYTQLYKALLSPTIGSDVDGSYRGMDGEVHLADGWTYYQTFSLWDTYRTQATLHGLIAPEIATDIVRSMYQHRVEGGWLPRWSLGGVETNIMAGDPVSAWVAENFTLGTVPDDIHDELWDALIENATTAPPEGVASVGRQSAAFYMEHGHIPYYSESEPGLGQQFEEYRHGGSSTMEFAISDAAIGAAAQRMGLDDVATEFLARGESWQTLWNPDAELTGGFQGIVNAVTPEGEFVTTSETASVQQSGFHEGVPWQYQWMANQDFEGMHELMGGTEAFLDRLDAYVNLEQLLANPGQRPGSWAPGGSSYYTSIGYNPGNEPTIMNAWLYSSAGEPEHVNDVLAANLNLFPNTPGGGVGNDDLGTLASWYVMASIGIQPVVPGSGMLALHSPRVQQAVVTLGESGETVTIGAEGATESTPSYIADVMVDGVSHGETWIDVDAFRAAGAIEFGLTTDAAATEWGTARDEWLPSVTDVTSQQVLAGANRWATSAAVSAASFEPGASVFLASGVGFADALAAGPAASHEDASLLLTRRDVLPPATLAELDRLQPPSITLVGGAAAISDDVLDALADRYPDAQIERLSGVNRYDTAATVAESVFGEATTAFIASGQEFADALSASGVAASIGDVPVLLVAKGTLPAATATALTGLGVEAAVVVGGSAAVSADVERALEDEVGDVTRVTGSNRYATNAALVAAYVEPASPQTVVVASGESFPDALSATAVAGATGGPLLLSTGGCMQLDSADALDELDVDEVVLVGGSAVLQPDAWQQRC